VGGFLGLMPAGGVTWDYIQYPLGLSLLGHDIYYIEDTRLYPVYQKQGSDWNDCSACVDHLQKVMSYFNMADRWTYRDEATGHYFGMSQQKVKEICRTADLFINLSCSTFMRDEYGKIPKRILIDSDPMFTQIQYSSQQMFTPGESGMKELIHAHNYLFSFGENIGQKDCKIPLDGLHWNITRQPVCLSYWPAIPLQDNSNTVFTTLMNWAAGKTLFYNNETWGQKDIEFLKFIQLPVRSPDVKLSMVVNKTDGTAGTLEKEKIESAGWKIFDAEKTAANWQDYQQFIHESSGEFSVAKQTYIKANTGWFSCRSACYLASARPVITQDTGWSKYIPTGNGLFAFTDMDEALAAIQLVKRNPRLQSIAAREIAAEYFDSDKVLNSLLEKIS